MRNNFRHHIFEISDESYITYFWPDRKGFVSQKGHLYIYNADLLRGEKIRKNVSLHAAPSWPAHERVNPVTKAHSFLRYREQQTL